MFLKSINRFVSFSPFSRRRHFTVPCPISQLQLPCTMVYVCSSAHHTRPNQTASEHVSAIPPPTKKVYGKTGWADAITFVLVVPCEAHGGHGSGGHIHTSFFEVRQGQRFQRKFCKYGYFEMLKLRGKGGKFLLWFNLRVGDFNAVARAPSFLLIRIWFFHPLGRSNPVSLNDFWEADGGSPANIVHGAKRGMERLRCREWFFLYFRFFQRIPEVFLSP